MTHQQQFDALAEQAGYNNVWPVVSCRWGYAAFVAYVIRIRQQTQPDEWWVGECNEDQRFVVVKRICQY